MSDISFFKNNTKSMMSIKGLESNIMMQSFMVEDSQDAQVVKALDNKVYINSFGNKIVSIKISGAVFAVGCNDSKALEINADHKTLYAFYKEHAVDKTALAINHHSVIYRMCHTTGIVIKAVTTTDLGYHFTFTISLIGLSPE